MSDYTLGRKKAGTSTFSNPSLVSPTTPTLANPVRGFGLPTNNVIQTATSESTNLQEAQAADEQSLLSETIGQRSFSHNISRISLHRPQAKLTVAEEENPPVNLDQTQANPDDEQTMVVEEEFEPEDSDVVPDQNWYIPTVSFDDGGDQQAEDSNFVAAPFVGFTDGGRTGTARYGDSLIANNDSRPHAFTDGGQTGTVVWGGGAGAGAHGNEGAGSIQVHIPPTFFGRTLSPTDADAWVNIGTARLDVNRSWVGINPGNQGNQHFVTTGAAARINQHETLHVANTRSNYTTHIDPLIARVGQFYAGISTQHAPTQAAAITTLQNFIQWSQSVAAFQNADRLANRPGGTVDTNDIASGTYPVDAGPGMVGGNSFQHRVRLPSEPNPV